MKFLWFLIPAVAAAAAAQEAPSTPSSFHSAFETRLAEIAQPFESRRETLVANYSGRVQKIQKQYQEKGDIEKVLQFKEELEHLQKNQSVGEHAVAELESIRGIFRRELKAIQEEEAAAIVNLRKAAVQTLFRHVRSATKAGEIENAKGFDEQLKAHQEEIEKLQISPSSKPEVVSANILSGKEADEFLASQKPTDNQIDGAKVRTSTSWQDRDPNLMLRKERTSSFDSMNTSDFWALNEKEGWIRTRWNAPVLAKQIVLVNRPGRSAGDLWKNGAVSLNGVELTEIQDFGRGEVLVIELKHPVQLSDMKIEIKEGTHHPGLHSIEIYK